MKKTILKISFVLLLILPLCLNVFAVQSPETDGYTVEFQSAVDAAGNKLDVVINDQSNAEIIADAMKIETIKTVMGARYTPDMIVVDIKEIIVPEGTVFPITITFTVKGVTPDTTGGFMHWTGSQWEWIDAIFGTDTMTGTFDSLSPVAFVINSDVTLRSVGTSPQTSDIAASAVTVLALSAAAVYLLKKRV